MVPAGTQSANTPEDDGGETYAICGTGESATTLPIGIDSVALIGADVAGPDTKGRRSMWIATTRQARRLLQGSKDAPPEGYERTRRFARAASHPLVQELRKIGAVTLIGCSLFLVLLVALGRECFLAIAYRDHLNAGMQALSYGHADRAQVELSLSISADPRSSEAYYYRGLAEVQRGSHGNALSDYKKAIELNPNNLKVYLTRAVLATKMHHYDEAISDCNYLIKQTPPYWEAYRVRANAYNHQLKFDEAIADSTKFLNEHKDWDVHRGDALAKRAFAFDQKKDYANAIRDYSESIACDPVNGSLYSSRAIVFMQAHRWNKALEDADLAIALRPNSPVAYKVRGICNARVSDTNESLADLDKLVSLYPSVDTHRLRGGQRLAAHDYLGSLEDFDYVLAAQPDDSSTSAQYLKSKSALQHRAQHKGIAADVPVEAHMPSETDLQVSQPELVRKGYDLYLRKEWQPAIKYLTAAVQSKPADATARRYLAHTLAAAGMHEHAITQFNALATTGSFLPADQLLVANALVACKQTKRAIGFYNDLLAGNPKNNEARTNLIKTLISTGAVDEAAKLAAQGGQQSPSLRSHYEKLFQQAMTGKNNKAPLM